VSYLHTSHARQPERTLRFGVPVSVGQSRDQPCRSNNMDTKLDSNLKDV
jgi:hypothetical protein